MTRSLAAVIVFLALLALPLGASATPLDAARIPADADGVGHVDMDALRKSTLHKVLAAKVIKEADWDDVEPWLRPLLRALLDSAQGVSFWLTSNSDVGAVLIRVPDPKRIQSLLDKIPHRKPIRVAGQTAYRVDESSKLGSHSDDHLVTLVGNLLLLADDEKSLGRAIEAAAGRAATLASARKVPDGAFDQGVFFFAALNDKILQHVKDAAQSQTLRLNLSSLTVHVAEIRADLQVRVKLVLGSADEAQKIKSMVEGVVALASLSDEAAEARPFLKGLKITSSGQVLQASIAMPSAEVVKIIESKR